MGFLNVKQVFARWVDLDCSVACLNWVKSLASESSLSLIRFTVTGEWTSKCIDFPVPEALLDVAVNDLLRCDSFGSDLQSFFV